MLLYQRIYYINGIYPTQAQNYNGQIAFRFEPLKKLGKGTFGQVWRCKDHKCPDQIVAVKVITVLPQSKHALNEASLLRSVNSEYVVKLVEDFEIKGTQQHAFVFPVMGPDLLERIRAGKQNSKQVL